MFVSDFSACAHVVPFSKDGLCSALSHKLIKIKSNQSSPLLLLLMGAKL